MFPLTGTWFDQAQHLFSVAEVLDMLDPSDRVRLTYRLHGKSSTTEPMTPEDALSFMEHINTVCGMAHRPEWKVSD